MKSVLENVQARASELKLGRDDDNIAQEEGNEELNTNDTFSDRTSSDKEKTVTKEEADIQIQALYQEIDSIFNSDDMLRQVLQQLTELPAKYITEFDPSVYIIILFCFKLDSSAVTSRIRSSIAVFRKRGQNLLSPASRVISSVLRN